MRECCVARPAEQDRGGEDPPQHSLLSSPPGPRLQPERYQHVRPHSRQGVGQVI